MVKIQGHDWSDKYAKDPSRDIVDDPPLTVQERVNMERTHNLRVEKARERVPFWQRKRPNDSHS